jgi:hypothetical protein
MELNINYEKSTKEIFDELCKQNYYFWLKPFKMTLFILIFSIFYSFINGIVYSIFMMYYFAIMYYLFEVKIMGGKFNFKKNSNYTKFINKDKKVLSKNNITGKLYHDINGNVFVNINDIYYLVSIDKNNDIELYEIDKSKLVELENTDNLEYDKIIDTEFTSLKKKVMDKIEEDDDSDQEETYQNYKQKIKYLNEDKYYYSEYKEDNNCDYEICGEENEKFKFYKKENDKSILLLNRGIDSLANYDTYIREDTKNVVASLICNDNNPNSYRISFYKIENNQRNLVELNIIGNAIKTYYLCYGYDGDKIELRFKKILEKDNY